MVLRQVILCCFALIRLHRAFETDGNHNSMETRRMRNGFIETQVIFKRKPGTLPEEVKLMIV